MYNNSDQGNMEYRNSVELVGVVGSARHTEVAGRGLWQFTVATNRLYRDSDSCPVVETCWHTCQYWEREDAGHHCSLEKGAVVRVTGRLSNQRYTGADGFERSVFSVVATQVEIMHDVESLQLEECDGKS